MKRTLVTVLAILLLAGCEKKEKEGAADSEKDAKSSSHSTRGPNGETILALDQQMQNRAGLVVKTLETKQVSPEIKGWGRVMDPAPIAALVNELTSDQAAYAASRQEFERLQTLSQQQNASARALQTAEAAARHDELQVQSARDRLVLMVGKSLATGTDLTVLIQSLVALQSALVRIDVPPGQPLKSEPVSVNLITLSGEQITARFLAHSPAVDPQTQNGGLLFLVETNSAGLAPGAAVTAYLHLAGELISRVAIPRSAVIRHEGATWIYVKTDGTNFTRREVVLDYPFNDDWFASRGATAGDEVVVTGAQTLLSEELNRSGFQGGDRD